MLKYLVTPFALFILTLSGYAPSRSQSAQGNQSALKADEFKSISRTEIEMLIADLAQKNPTAIKRLAENPELKRKQLDSLKQLLAFASQAQKEGLADEPSNRQELNSIRSEVIAVNYDQETNKDKGPKPPFGFITDDQVKQYWADGSENDSGSREAQFRAFLDSKLELLKRENPQFSDDQISQEDKKQAREYFTKVQIYKKECDAKIERGELSTEFVQKTELQVKLQQAQFLAKLYSEKIADQAKVTDSDVAQYVAAHKELDVSAKKAKALGILNRAKAGEDFTKLANEYTEDPGNKNSKGELQGGEYKDVTKGTMVPPFEQAALALEPGQIAPDLVESDFGYHIIKLEKKGEGKDTSGKPTEIYDVRHILISTTYKDPKNPAAMPVPVKEYARQELSTAKQKKIIDDIVAANNISVPDDYSIPEISEKTIHPVLKNPQRPAVHRKAPAHRRHPSRKIVRK